MATKKQERSNVSYSLTARLIAKVSRTAHRHQVMNSRMAGTLLELGLSALKDIEARERSKGAK
jgi:hypothetical protein